ncbi:protein LSM14, partial [Lecanoromycetidae sp. Uapishka_2]
MAEYIGCKISLISKRDIRYVGTLHEISSENSTVALEQVKSFGTEGRSPGNEVAAQDNIYEYIVFRGSDVKDLRIEKEPEEKPAPQPQVPDDPAILGLRNRQTNSHSSRSLHLSKVVNRRNSSEDCPSNLPLGKGLHDFNSTTISLSTTLNLINALVHKVDLKDSLPMAIRRCHMVLLHLAGQFGPPGQAPMQQGPPSKPATPAEASGDAVQAAATTAKDSVVDKPAATVKLPSSSTTPAPSAVAQDGPPPPPPKESKPNVNEALAPPAPAAPTESPATFASAAAKVAPSAPKSGRIMPAIPLTSPAGKPRAHINGASRSIAPAATVAPTNMPVTRSAQAPTKSIEDASRDARAAVQAAMAKLPGASGQQKKQTNGDSVALDNLTNKVNEMRTNDNIRTSRQPGTGGYAAGHRGGRGNHRNTRPREDQHAKKMEVPTTDYDFAEANAKFNKQDLVKEAIASGDPINSPVDGDTNASAESSINVARRGSEQSVTIPAAPGYSKSSSFFDNISSEAKDRDDKKVGGREFRSEEQKKNLETFGQGSVDNGYRGGYRGRGRGRGGYRGRARDSGYSSRGRGRGGAVTAEG